jgi:hypothetical protein
MVDYHLLRSTNHKLPEPDPEEEQAVPEPVVVDVVYNAYEEGKGKTIALKVSFSVPWHRTGALAANK